MFPARSCGEKRMRLVSVYRRCGTRGIIVKQENMSTLRAFSLCFLLPGLAGLILSTSISTHYLNALPRYPDPQHLRMVPRNINGYTVYQSTAEDRRLDTVEYSSVGLFIIGTTIGLVYLRKWGIARAIEAEDDEFVAGEG
jgi:hypothetical protein